MTRCVPWSAGAGIACLVSRACFPALRRFLLSSPQSEDSSVLVTFGNQKFQGRYIVPEETMGCHKANMRVCHAFVHLTTSHGALPCATLFWRRGYGGDGADPGSALRHSGESPRTLVHIYLRLSQIGFRWAVSLMRGKCTFDVHTGHCVSGLAIGSTGGDLVSRGRGRACVLAWSNGPSLGTRPGRPRALRLAPRLLCPGGGQARLPPAPGVQCRGMHWGPRRQHPPGLCLNPP